MDTNLQFNALEFLKRLEEDMRSDVKYAYSATFNQINPGNAHPALQRISSKLEVLRAFLASMESAPVGDKNR